MESTVFTPCALQWKDSRVAKQKLLMAITWAFLPHPALSNNLIV